LITNFLDNNKKMFIYASSLFAFTAIIACIVFPHGIIGVSRVEYYLLFISAIFFIFIGRSIFDVKLMLPYILLAIAFFIPILYHFNQSTYYAFANLIPLLIGSYVISWHFKNNNFSKNFYFSFCIVILMGIILCLIQNITATNYWLINLYDIEMLNEHLNSSNGMFPLDPGFGYGLESETLGFSSLFLSLIILGAYIYKNVSFLTMIILLSFSNIGMLLSGWRVIWLAYFVTIFIMFLIRRKFNTCYIWGISIFTIFYLLLNILVEHTKAFPPNSNIVRGSEGRFLIQNKNKDQMNKSIKLKRQYNNIDARLWHWNYFIPLLKSNNILGSGPKSYYEKTTYSYVKKNHPNFTYENKEKDYKNFFKKSSFDALNSFIVIGIEYGLWALFFISWSFYLIIRQIINIFRTKTYLGCSMFVSLAIFTSVLLIISTRTYQFTNFAWFSLAFLIGSLYCNDNKKT